MARVYLDEDVSVLLAALLKARGVDAQAVRDLNMLGRTDEEHLHKAIELQRILISHNRVDFEALYSKFLQKNITFPDIILLGRKRDIYECARRLVKFISQHPNLENQLWYL